jgi:ribosomal protein L17
MSPNKQREPQSRNVGKPKSQGQNWAKATQMVLSVKPLTIALVCSEAIKTTEPVAGSLKTLADDMICCVS